MHVLGGSCSGGTDAKWLTDILFPLAPCFPCLVHAQEQIKGKLDLTPVSRTMSSYTTSSAISRARTSASPGSLRGKEALRTTTASLASPLAPTAREAAGLQPFIWRRAASACRPRKAPRGVCTAAPARSPRARTACARKTAAVPRVTAPRSANNPGVQHTASATPAEAGGRRNRRS